MPQDDLFDVNALPMDDDSFRQEEISHNTGDWDQFAGNAHLISGQSSYNELLYTTPIPKNIPKHWAERAVKFAGENPTPDTGRVTDDEETNHSRVVDASAGNPPEVSGAKISSPNKRKNANPLPSLQHSTQRVCPAEGCSWKTPPHGGQWQACYNHVAHRHGESVPTDGWERDGRFLCKDCGRHYDKNKEKSHPKHCKGHNLHVRSPTPPRPTTCPRNAADVPPENLLPTLSSVWALPISTCKDVPHSCGRAF